MVDWSNKWVDTGESGRFISNALNSPEGLEASEQKLKLQKNLSNGWKAVVERASGLYRDCALIDRTRVMKRIEEKDGSMVLASIYWAKHHNTPTLSVSYGIGGHFSEKMIPCGARSSNRRSVKGLAECTAFLDDKTLFDISQLACKQLKFQEISPQYSALQAQMDVLTHYDNRRIEQLPYSCFEAYCAAYASAKYAPTKETNEKKSVIGKLSDAKERVGRAKPDGKKISAEEIEI